MYTSTRKKISKHASYAILKGLSDDGGLFVAESIDHTLYQRLQSSKYHDIAHEVFSYFLNDYSSEMVTSIVECSYGNQFKPDIVTINSHEDVSMLNVFHGPTFAFKDIALQALPQMFEYAKKIQNIHKKTIILTATSGDTGGAALDGFSNVENTMVIVLYPTLGVSEFQQKQMMKYQSETCLVYGIDGNFDDCQNIVKLLFNELSLTHIQLSSANSINIGRIIAQIVYYMYSYKQLFKKGILNKHDLLDIIVPSGNFGNIYAAYLAKQLGTPLGKLVVASNENNVLTSVFKNNIYKVSQKLHQTISPSMDILVSSNLERYLYDLSPDPIKIESLYTTFKNTQEVSLEMMKNQDDFEAYFASEDETLSAIKSYYDQYHTLIDPHTAVGFYCYEAYHKNQTNNHSLIVSTASPYKFPHAVLKAFNQDHHQELGDAMNALKALDRYPIDERIYDVIHGHGKEHILSLDAAKSYIEKVIKTYDIPN